MTAQPKRKPKKIVVWVVVAVLALIAGCSPVKKPRPSAPDTAIVVLRSGAVYRIPCSALGTDNQVFNVYGTGKEAKIVFRAPRDVVESIVRCEGSLK